MKIKIKFLEKRNLKGGYGMKTLARFLLTFLILFSFAIAKSVDNQKVEWKGKIENKNGITIIKNPREPLYGEIKFELEEDLSIGREDDDNYMFFAVGDIEVDSKENIYVADKRNYRIQKFDRNGIYVQTIGRQGQGPGEFKLPTRIRINETTGDIYIKDQAFGIEIFDKQGAHIKVIKTKKSFSDFRLDEDGNIIAVFRTVSELGQTNSVSKTNLEGEILETYAEFPYNRFRQKWSETGVFISISGWEKDVLISKINNKTFVYGYSEKYDLGVIDKNGQLLYKIKKDEPVRKFPAKERDRLKKINLGEYQPFYYLIFTDSEGRIYVQTNKTWLEEDVTEKEVDIFSKDGYYLYKTTLPKHTRVIKNGYLYALEVEDDELVKRYRIKNWDKIKEGI